MGREKRKGEISIPANLEEMLNEAQKQALPGIEYLGWELRFLRKPLFQEPVFVVQNTNDGRIGTMDGDGRIRLQANIKVRKQASQAQTPLPSNPLVWTK
jgi:hypothetical protein